MYLHAGNNKIIREKDIIGIFDMDNSTVSPDTRSFLRLSQSEKKLVSDVRDIPKSFVVTSERVYLSQVSSHTLVGRGERGG